MQNIELLTFWILCHNVTYYDVDGKTPRLNEHVCVKHMVYMGTYTLFKNQLNF